MTRASVLSGFIPGRFFGLWLISCLVVPAVRAQRDRGELRLAVHDPQGAAVSAKGELVSEANQFSLSFQVGDGGRYVARDLAFGIYRLSLTHPGFVPYTRLIEIRSIVPEQVSVTMGLTPVQTEVQVTSTGTLIDTSRAGTVYTVGPQAVSEQLSAQPGRSLLNLVNDQPGWIYEANGVLHPRGSEYDVQFVVDGLPVTQNRSPAFAPPFESQGVSSMRVLTAGFPAEYGRKLGGVIELTTPQTIPAGLHGEFEAAGGSFSTGSGYAALSYSKGKNWFSAHGNGFHTGRYLDPPVLANYTNTGNAGGFSGSYEREFSETDRASLSVMQSAVRYLVPNELIQQQAGQRQDVRQKETSGQIRYQHVISPEVLLSLAGSVRDTSALLSSNPLSTPVIVSQDRGYREGYARADLAGHHGRHDWKMGADAIFNPVHEALQYQITDPAQFDSEIQRQFQFSDRRWDIEPAAYVQDQMHFGKWNISAGLRFDHYSFVVHDSAWSPRLGISRYIASLDLLIHGSYGRIFQTPALENLLLASSPTLDSVSPLVLRLPVQPGHANYYEVGFTKGFAGKLRLEANVFRRDFRNFADDDTLLDTGISFPIAFAKAHIYGEEIQVSVLHWRGFSGFISYANQVGTGQGPVTGGLFLGDQAASASATTKFPISQDQRNSLRGRVRFQATPQFWLATSAEYGSGLPVSLEGPVDLNFYLAQYGSAVLDQVNFAAGRVRPNFSLDVAAGATFYHKESKEVSAEVEVDNLTNRLNLLNFASLFSGTAIAVPRSFSVRMKLAF